MSAEPIDSDPSSLLEEQSILLGLDNERVKLQAAFPVHPVFSLSDPLTSHLQAKVVRRFPRLVAALASLASKQILDARNRVENDPSERCACCISQIAS